MVQVLLMNHWNAPSSRLFRKSLSKKGPPVDIPADLVYDENGKSQLPSSAIIVDDDYQTPAPVKSADTLSEHRKMLDANDPARAAALAEGDVRAKAEADLAAQREENKRKFNVELAAEKQKTDNEATAYVERSEARTAKQAAKAEVAKRKREEGNGK